MSKSQLSMEASSYSLADAARYRITHNVDELMSPDAVSLYSLHYVPEDVAEQEPVAREEVVAALGYEALQNAE